MFSALRQRWHTVGWAFHLMAVIVAALSASGNKIWIGPLVFGLIELCGQMLRLQHTLLIEPVDSKGPRTVTFEQHQQLVEVLQHALAEWRDDLGEQWSIPAAYDFLDALLRQMEQDGTIRVQSAPQESLPSN